MLDLVRQYGVIVDWGTGELLRSTTEQFRAMLRAPRGVALGRGARSASGRRLGRADDGGPVVVPVAFPDRPLGYREAKRVLKRGGCFLFNVWDRIEENVFATM